MTRQARTLLEVCVARAVELHGGESMVGQLRAMPKGTRVCQYVVEWAIALQDGCEPTVRDVAAYWREPERTAYRRNAAFQELFPDEPNPARIAAAIAAGLRGKPTAAALARRPVPA